MTVGAERSGKGGEEAEIGRWVAEARAGSRSAFAQLVDRFQAPLHAFLLQRARSPEDAEELCQEAFLRAWRRLELYDSRWRFSTWLFTLARNVAVSRARRPRREQTGEEQVEGSTPASSDPAAIAMRSEESRNVWLLARRVLSADQHRALWLRYAEDWEPAAIAAVLGKSTATVRVLLFRARARLAQCLSPTEEGGDGRGSEPCYTAAEGESR